jgi:hypothetical protein
LLGWKASAAREKCAMNQTEVGGLWIPGGELEERCQRAFLVQVEVKPDVRFAEKVDQSNRKSFEGLVCKSSQNGRMEFSQENGTDCERLNEASEILRDVLNWKLRKHEIVECRPKPRGKFNFRIQK